MSWKVLHQNAKENASKNAWKEKSKAINNETKKRSIDKGKKLKGNADNPYENVKDKINECSKAVENINLDDNEIQNVLNQMLEMLKTLTAIENSATVNNDKGETAMEIDDEDESANVTH